MVMAGFFFLRRCASGQGGDGKHRNGRHAVFPENCELLEATVEHAHAHPDKHDQFSFNAGRAPTRTDPTLRSYTLHPRRRV